MATVTISQITDTLKSKLNVASPEIVSEEAPKQPNIHYHPDRREWEARTARRLANNPSLPTTALPDGFPKVLTSPLVWEGKDWKDEKQWVYELNASELKEIDEAVKHFHGTEKPLGLISQSTFPLPTLGKALGDLSNEIHNGRGFSVVRGIPVAKYSREDNIIIYAGVSSYVGALRGLQDGKNGVISHIKDLQPTHGAQAIGSPAYTTDKQVFHTDSGDIISLFALETAAEGGTSLISSSWQVYNYLAENRPDLIKTLAEPWPVDEFGANPPYSTRPLLHYLDEKIIIHYGRRYFVGFQGLPRSTDIPPITEAQAEVLDTIHFLAEKFALRLDFQKGDIQYINNLSIFHAREGFRDDAEHTYNPTTMVSRHLLRLWLRNEDLAWPTPEPLKARWHELFHSTPPEDHYFALDPVIRAAVKARSAK